MNDFIVRLEEVKELKEETEKLDRFINTDAFKELSSTNRDLLVTQLHIMASYCAILATRLGRLK